jgi:hypothetical protein
LGDQEGQEKSSSCKDTLELKEQSDLEEEKVGPFSC